MRELLLKPVRPVAPLAKSIIWPVLKKTQTKSTWVDPQNYLSIFNNINSCCVQKQYYYNVNQSSLKHFGRLHLHSFQ